jgi:Domain of unknown function (DUF1902)
LQGASHAISLAAAQSRWRNQYCCLGRILFFASGFPGANIKLMQNPFIVTAIWDSVAHVFTTESDIPGLVVEADTFEELVDLVEALAPEVIAANLPDATPPYRVQVETRRELAVA